MTVMHMQSEVELNLSRRDQQAGREGREGFWALSEGGKARLP